VREFYSDSEPAEGSAVALAHVIGFIVMMAIMGWHPTDKRGRALPAEPPVSAKVAPAS